MPAKKPYVVPVGVSDELRTQISALWLIEQKPILAALLAGKGKADAGTDFAVKVADILGIERARVKVDLDFVDVRGTPSLRPNVRIV